MSLYLLLSIILTVAATSYFSSLNLALVQASRSGLETELEARGLLERGGWILARMQEASHAVAFFRTLGRVALFATVLVAFEGFGEASRVTLGGLLATAAVSVALVWLFTSVLSSAIARHATYATIATSLPFIRVTLIVVGPLLAAVGFVDEVVRRLSGANLREDETEERLIHSIEDRKREGEIDPVAATLLQRAVVFGQTTVASVMTPRTDIEAIELSDDLASVREQMAAIGHSRIPVYSDSLDEIVGILYVRDLVRHFGAATDGFRMKPLLREPLRVPETKPVGELLRDFQQSEVHMAVVVDEYGGTSGLCTIEDVLEEIVGEIHDEHEPADELPPTLVESAEGVFEADGRVPITEVNERLGLSLPEDGDFDTVAGYLLDRFGRVPERGESEELPEAVFEIAAAGPTRIDRVTIRLREDRGEKSAAREQAAK
ncbi:MAG: hemolysin family protein [Planctomycetaceae bacterium]|nr:hemolysin family protein [Planctomycetaceae bacterium]